VIAVRQAAHDPFAFGDAYFKRTGKKGAQNHAVAIGMAAENGEWIVMVGVGDPLQFAAERVIFHFRVLDGSMIAGGATAADSGEAGMVGWGDCCSKASERPCRA